MSEKNLISLDSLRQGLSTKSLQYYNFYNVDIPTTTLYASDYYKKFTHDTIDVEQKVNIFLLDIEVYTNNLGIEDDEYIHPIHMITGHSTQDNIIWVFVYLMPDVVEKFGILNTDDFDYDKFIIERQSFFKTRLTEMGYLGSKFIKSDYEVKLKLYNDEQTLLLDFWKTVHEYDDDVLSGWNCVKNTDSLWLSDQIINIKHAKTNKSVYNFGKINKIKHTTHATQYEILLENGQTITTSNLHKFPTYSKSPSNKLIKLADLAVVEILYNLNNKQDQYLEIVKRVNKQNHLSYKNLLLKNIDYFINHFNLFNLYLEGANIPIKNLESINNYQFKYIQHNVLKEDIISYIESSNMLTFYINKKLVTININQPINPKILQVLGYAYVNGSYDSVYLNVNAQTDIDQEYIKLIPKIYYSEGAFNTVKIFTENPLYLLLPLIYSNFKYKQLDKTLLSQLSFSQFCHFISGVIDGFAEFNLKGTKEDLKTLQELLLWNNVSSILHDDKLCISTGVANTDFFMNLDIKFKQINRNIIKPLNIPKRSFSKIKSISVIEYPTHMVDLNIEKSYFISNGIITHNCDMFDMPYIYGRMKYLYGKDDCEKIMSKFGQVDHRYGTVCPFEYTVSDLLYLYRPRDEGGF